jgi:hypothetical protein
MWISHRLLRALGQPLHAILMEQAAYFRLMRKHGVPPFVLSTCRLTIDAWVSMPRRAFSFREGSCFSGAEIGVDGLGLRTSTERRGSA